MSFDIRFKMTHLQFVKYQLFILEKSSEHIIIISFTGAVSK